MSLDELDPSPARPVPRLPSHIPALDGLRGWAILLVLGHHFTTAGRDHGIVADLLCRTMYNGWVGVDLFFVLSGFLITGILLDARGTPHFLRNFYARRVFRIFPLYYGVLAVVFAIAATTGGGSIGRFDSALANQKWFWLYGVNFLYANGGWEGVALGHFWSLAVEEHFYMLWPFLVLICPRKWLAGVCLFFMAGALALRVYLTGTEYLPFGYYILTPCRMDSLAMGGLLALLVRGRGGVATLIKPARIVAGITGVVLAGLLVKYHLFVRPGGEGFRLVSTVGFTTLALFFASTLLLLINPQSTSSLRALVNNRPMRLLGKYSYGLYVFHYLLKPFIDLRLSPELLAPKLHSFVAAVIVYFVIASALSLGAAMLSWHLFEKHFLKLKHYFEYARPKLSAAPVG